MIACSATDWLKIDPEHETCRITGRLRQLLARDLKRRGFVIALSGGIDSTVTAALAVKAVGKERVFGLLMPERQSDPDTSRLSRLVADSLGIEYLEDDITGVLEALGFYRRYDAAVRTVVPEFDAGWKSKIAIQEPLRKSGFAYFVLIAQSPDGLVVRKWLPLEAYLEVVASTNFKQRTRKMLEYYHADRLNFAVAGTANRLEHDQGFFVKGGDGAADVKPIAHLYKTQVYQLATHLGVPDAVRERTPTTDTYSLPQSQDEFYFSVPYWQMDLCLYGKNHGRSVEEVAHACNLPLEKVQRVWISIDRKRTTTRYLHRQGLMLDDVPQVESQPRE